MQRPTTSRPVNTLIAARALGAFGTEASYVALFALLWQATGSGKAIATLLTVHAVVRLVSGPIAGVLGDLLNRRIVITVCMLISAVAWTAMFIDPSPTSLILWSTIHGPIAVSMMIPSITASVPALAPEGKQETSVASMSVARTVTGIAGPGFAGAALIVISAHQLLLINAILQVIGAICVFSIRFSFHEPADHAECIASDPRASEGSDVTTRIRGGLDTVGAGFKAIANDLVLLRLTTGWLFFSVGFGLISVAEAPIAWEMGAGAAGLGMITVAWCVGALAGGIVARQIATTDQIRASLLAAGTVIGTMAFAATADAISFTTVLVCMTIGGLGVCCAGTIDSILFMNRTHDGVRARVSSAADLANGMCYMGGLIIGGRLIDVIGAHDVYALAAFACMGGTWLLALAAAEVAQSQAGLRAPRLAGYFQQLLPAPSRYCAINATLGAAPSNAAGLVMTMTNTNGGGGSRRPVWDR